jgi:urease accessory protein
MTSHWPHPLQKISRLHPAVSGGKAGCFELSFRRHGPRTRIGRQFISYPFHLTRPFAFDEAIPSLATIYQQSSSGGLYRAEQLWSRFELEAHSAAHVTTQAATVIHDCHGEAADLHTAIRLEEGAFLALTPDPLVLFPGASCTSAIEIVLAPGAALLLADAFACHDPFPSPVAHTPPRRFERLDSDVVLRDPSDRLLVRDCFTISGSDLAASTSPVGGWKAVSNYMLAGAAARLPPRERLEDLCSAERLVGGVTELPNKAGWGIRCLAADAIAARVFAERLFALSVESAFGVLPTPRRK